MDKQNLIREVKLRCPQELISYVPEAIDALGVFIKHQGRYSTIVEEYHRSDIPKIIEFIGRLAPLLSKRGEGEKQQPSIKLTPDTLLTSDYLVDTIKHWVELVRSEIFESPEVPFDSIAEAAAWIAEQEKAEPPPGEDPPHSSAGPSEIFLYIKGKDGERKEFLGNRIEGLGIAHRIHEEEEARLLLKYLPHLRNIPYLGHDGNECYARLTSTKPSNWSYPEARTKYYKRKKYPGRTLVDRRTIYQEQIVGFTPLSWLDNETQLMERSTGFTQLSLVQYVLTGSKPIMQRFTTLASRTGFNLPNGERLQPTKVEINIFANDLTFQELQQIYAHSRAYLNIQRGKMLNEKHLALYLLVSSKGGPVKGKGTVDFWESVRKDWNSLYPDDNYHSWKGVKQNYERIIDKLKERFESNTPGRITIP